MAPLPLSGRGSVPAVSNAPQRLSLIAQRVVNTASQGESFASHCLVGGTPAQDAALLCVQRCELVIPIRAALYDVFLMFTDEYLHSCVLDVYRGRCNPIRII